MTAAHCSTASAHCTANGHDVAWNVVQPRDGGRLLKLPSYPWQTKRFWNETQEAAEALFYDPVHPLLGQSVSALHPTWEAELSTVLNAFLADHRVQGSVVVPGAVYVEMALAAANATYGSNHSVDNLVLHRAVILDDTCDPILRTTLNEDDGTLEFAAFTATADGDSKWTITATAELNTLPTAPRRHDPPDGAEPVTSIGGDDFYARTQSIGFDYGDAFRSVQGVTAGEDWAVAEITIPAAIADELDALPIPSGARRRRLPNTLRRTISRAGGERGPVPARPGSATARSTVHPKSTCGSTSASCRRPAKRSRATSRSPTAPGRLLAVFDGFVGAVAERLVAACRPIVSTRDCSRFSGASRPTRRMQRARPAREHDRGFVLAHPRRRLRRRAQPSPKNCVAAATASSRSNTNPSVGSPRSTGVT